MSETKWSDSVQCSHRNAISLSNLRNAKVRVTQFIILQIFFMWFEAKRSFNGWRLSIADEAK